MELPVNQIQPAPFARKIDPKTVNSLSRSIKEIGIINPLRVRQAGNGYQLIAGRHRLEAAKMLSLETVPCLIATDDDLHAELAMIDENLCRAELSPAERALAISRRKAIYEELHPSTKHGGDRKSDQVAKSATRFSAETAEATGRSERTVQLDAQRGTDIAPDVLERIAGTTFDTGTYLDSLKGMEPDKQRERVEREMADPPAKPTINEEHQLALLMSAWRRATEAIRRKFLEWLKTEA